MSHAATTTTHAVPDPGGNDAWEAVFTRIQRPALLVGGAGLLIAVIGLIFWPESALRSYLWAFMYWAAIPLGSLAFLMIQHMTGGTWGLLARRVFEASASLIVLIAVLFLPLLIAVLVGYDKLYPWLNSSEITEKILGHYVNVEHVRFKSAWLSKGFFILRALGYFALWTFLAYYLYAWSGREDRTGNNPRFAFAARFVSGPGILFGGLAINFAMLDWVMTLDPSWYSTMFGVLYIVGSGLVTMAFTILVIRLVADRTPIRAVISPGVLNDLGNLMFAFTLLWAYTNFSQLLIIWSGNIAEETPYYYVRNMGSWGGVALLVVIFHFFVPFLLLLWRKIKRDVRLLAGVALLMLVMRGVDLFWIVKPMFLQRQITIPQLAVHHDDPKHGKVDHGGEHPKAAPENPKVEPAHPAPGGAEPAQEHHDAPAAKTAHAAPAHTTASTAAHRDGPVGTYTELYDPANPDAKYHAKVDGVFAGGIHLFDIPAFAGIGGLFVAAFAWRLKQRPLLPPNDPRLADVLHGGHH